MHPNAWDFASALGHSNILISAVGNQEILMRHKAGVRTHAPCGQSSQTMADFDD